MPKLVCMWKCPASLWGVPGACYWGQGLWRWRLCRRIVCMPCLCILANQQLYVLPPVYGILACENTCTDTIPVHLAHCALECAAPYVWIRENVHWLYTASCLPSWYRFQRPVMGSHADAIHSNACGNIRATQMTHGHVLALATSLCVSHESPWSYASREVIYSTVC